MTSLALSRLVSGVPFRRGLVTAVLLVGLPLSALAQDAVPFDDLGSGAALAEAMAEAPLMTREQLVASLDVTPEPGPFRIVLVPGPGLQASAAAQAAFRRAAAQWEARIRTPITVTLAVDILPGGGELGLATPRFVHVSFDGVVSLLRAAADGESGDAVNRSLPQASEAVFRAPPGFIAAPDTLVLAKANLKALGFSIVDDILGVLDGEIRINSRFAFDLDNRDGVGPGLFDLESVFVHEIGHSLGFVSIVDALETPLPMPPRTFLPTSLDLFRFRRDERPTTASGFTDAVRDVQPAVESIFGDVAHAFALSTGRTGDGRNASHWKDELLTRITIGVMDPTLNPQTVLPMTAADLRALDLIGYDIAVAEALPSVSITSVGGLPASANLAVAANTPVTFVAQASDADGLGSPVLADLGSTTPISFLWNAPGAQLSAPLSDLTPRFTASFPLAADAPTRTASVQVTAFDSLGDASTAQLSIRVSNPPAVRLLADGAEFQGLFVRDGATVRFLADASDADGLGFPVFAAFGVPGNVSFLWNFDGASVPDPLFAFAPDPPVTFRLQPGETVRRFAISVTVTDRLGLSTTRSLPVTVRR